MKKVFFCLLCLFISLETYSQMEPTISTCTGEQGQCISGPIAQICVSINLNNFDQAIDHFEIDWDDDKPVTVIPFGDPIIGIPHEYDLSSFFNSCQYSKDDFTIKLKTFLVSEELPPNNSFTPTFLNPPRVVINIPSTVCVNQEAQLDLSKSCPSGNYDIIAIDYGDGSSNPDLEDVHVYDEVGTYTLKVTLGNDCNDNVSATQTIFVIESAIAKAVPLAGIVSSIDEPYTVCLGNTVDLDGDSLSTGEFQYEWQVIDENKNNYDWILKEEDEKDNRNDNTPNVPDLGIKFKNPGTFNVVLTVDNTCNIEDRDTLTFEVIDASSFTLNKQEDGCIALEYTPTPWDAGVTYLINGEITSNFPINLDVGQYIIEASNPANVCVTGSLRDTFSVLAVANARINELDTTICSVDGMFQLSAFPANAEWQIDGQPFDGTINPDLLDQGTYLVTYGKEPCVKLDTINVEVIKAGIEFGDKRVFCLDEVPTQITVNTSTEEGLFSGKGISAEGLFNPALAGIGAHTIYYQADNEALPSCSNQDSLVLEVIDLIVDFQIDTCNGSTLFFNTSDSTSTYQNIKWDFGDGSMSEAPSPSHTFDNAQTYLVKVTIFLNNCQTTMERSITIESPPMAGFTVTHNRDNCAVLEVAIEDNSTGSNLVYQWDFGNGTKSSEATPPTLLYDAVNRDTAYTITLMVKNDCATSEHIVTIPVKARAKALLGTRYDKYCSGELIETSNNSSGTPFSYVWLKNGEVISVDSMPPRFQHLTAKEDTITLSLIVENSCAIDTFNKKLLIQPTDVKAFFNIPDSIVCVGEQLCFTNLSNTNQIIFDLGNGVKTDSLTFCYSYPTLGTYQIELQALGCGYDVLMSEIQVKPKPAIQIKSLDIVCPDIPITFEAAGEDIAGIKKYSWDLGDSTEMDLSKVIHQYDALGIYTVCLKTESTNACKQEICKKVTVPAAPKASFTIPDSTFCIEGDVFINSELTEANNLSCHYDFGDGNFSDKCNPTHQYSDSKNYIIQQTVINNFGCADSLTKPLFIQSLPIPNFEVDTEIPCGSSKLAFKNLSLNADSYEWNFGEGTTSTLTNPTNSFQVPKKYTVQLTAKKNGVCKATKEKVIEIFPIPVTTIEIGKESLCATKPLSFSTPLPEEDIKVSWNFGDGEFAYTPSVTHIFAASGNYLVTVIQSTEYCADTADLAITVQENPLFDATIIPIKCHNMGNGSIELTAIAGTTPFEYQWSHGVTNPKPDNLPTGVYNVTVTDANYCQWTEAISLNEPEAIQTKIIQQQDINCFGEADGLLEVQVTGGVPDYLLNWSNGNSTPIISNLKEGTYELSITDANNCQVVSSFYIAQKEEINWENGAFDLSCFGANDGIISLENVTGGLPNYIGQILELGDEQGTYFVNLLPATYTLLVTDELGCSKSFTTAIKEPPPIWIDIEENNQLVRQGTILPLHTSHNVANPVFEWTPAKGLDCIDCAAPTAQPHELTKYLVELTNENGCTANDSITIDVTIERGFAIPDAFTPDGDGHNDKFYPMANNPGITTIKSFRIYDRWGGILYEVLDFPVSDPQFGWNGVNKGKTVQPGNYLYHLVIEYVDGFITEKQGTFLLIR